MAEHDHASELITEKLVERRGIFATKVMTIFLGNLSRKERGHEESRQDRHESE